MAKKKLALTDSEQKVLSLLLIGEENKIERKDLVSKSGFCDRYVRSILRSLRIKGINISSNSKTSGYWLSSGHNDDKTFVEQMTRHGKQSIASAKVAKKELKVCEHQKSFFEGGNINECI